MTHHRDTLRRDISGIYIRDILPQDGGKRRPTCIEDCNDDTRLKWLDDQTVECLANTAGHLNDVFDCLWNNVLTEYERNDLLRANYGRKPHCDTSEDKDTAVRRIDAFCRLLRYICECRCICAEGSEAALKDTTDNQPNELNQPNEQPT